MLSCSCEVKFLIQRTGAGAHSGRTKIHHVKSVTEEVKVFVSVCEQSDREAALRLVLEAQIREEVSAEFMELFNKMEKDYR